MQVTCSFCKTESSLIVSDDDQATCPNCGRLLLDEATEEFRSKSTDHSTFTSRHSGHSLEHKTLKPGDYVGKYKIVRQVAQGGFGTVYQGINETLDQRVAIKVPRYDRLDSDAAIEQFLREARTTAQLGHPNIVPVYDAEEDANGHVYIAMKWIEGRTLSDFIKETDPPLDVRIEIICQVAEAVHYAHKKGFIHRDLKPSNIMIGTDGRPVVMDFGLALHEDIQHRHRGELAGTLAYMSPELIRGESHFVDGRADVWSLGVMLYELLAGKRPFTAKTDMAEEIQERTPKPVHLANPDVSTELNEICLQALRKRVDERTATARDFAHQLQKAAKSPQRVGSTLRRHRSVVVSTIALVLLAATTVAVLFSNRESKELDGLVVQPLAFPDRDTAKWVVDDGELDIQTDAPSLFTFHELPHDEFTFSIEVYQVPWVGNFGLVFGLDGNRYQMIKINRNRDGGFHANREVVETIRTPGDGPTTTLSEQPLGRIQTSSATQASSFRRISIEVKGGELINCQFGETRLSELCKTKRPDISEIPAMGKIGIYVDRVGVRVRRPVLDGEALRFRPRE